MKVITITCQQCKNDFAATYNGRKTPLYCGSKCRNAGRMARERERREALVKIAFCPACHRPFKPRQTRSTTCGERNCAYWLAAQTGPVAPLRCAPGWVVVVADKSPDPLLPGTVVRASLFDRWAGLGLTEGVEVIRA